MNQLGMKLIQSPKHSKMVRKVSASGTIKRGFEPYGYEDSPAGMNLLKQIKSLDSLDRTRRWHYMKFIASCHAAGDGRCISDERKISWCSKL
jgi:hypothetical protein